MELRSPIRLFWDITPLPAILPDYDRITAEIASSRVLTLQITDLSDRLSQATVESIGQLSGSGIAVSLTVTETALAEAIPLMDAGVKRLYADIPAPDLLQCLQIPKGCGISFRPAPGTVDLLPDLLTACLDREIPELVLPMERIITGEHPLCLSRARQKILTSRLAMVPFKGRIGLTIHDPFLWRAFYPDTPFPDGSCQACNTMLAISPSGDVYPCPAMPYKLGSLSDTHFREIVASKDKRTTRLMINSVPPACATCRLYPGCRGGCRGRGYYLNGDWETPDPACSFPE